MSILTPEQLERLFTLHHTAPLSEATLHAAFAELFALMTNDGVVTEQTHLPGEVIFREGDGGSTMCLIQTGRVAVVKGDLSEPVVLSHRSAGEIVGEMALLEDRPRSASVVALENVRSLSVERGALRKLLGQHPELAMSLLSMLSARLRSSGTNLDRVARVEEQLNEELEFAAQIQARLLPRTLPNLAGWDIAAKLIPARKTSGDFYDFIPSGPGRLGVLVADVVDKGTAAALYMAVSRTLLRTFAQQNHTAPEETLRMTNERIQEDVGSDQFVTVFYGVLDSTAGTLVYANAGHNPAYVLRQGEVTRELGKTGIPIGVFEEITWRQDSVQFQPGDMLVLYTDGVSEARNAQHGEFGTAQMLAVAKAQVGRPAQEILDAVIRAIKEFIGDAPQFDDITLLVAVRQP